MWYTSRMVLPEEWTKEFSNGGCDVLARTIYEISAEHVDLWAATDLDGRPCHHLFVQIAGGFFLDVFGYEKSAQKLYDRWWTRSPHGLSTKRYLSKFMIPSLEATGWWPDPRTHKNADAAARRLLRIGGHATR